MKELKKEDLKDGEVYVGYSYFSNNDNERFVFMYSFKNNIYEKLGYKSRIVTYLNNSCAYTKNSSHSWTKNLRYATPEEKHWLQTYIEKNKFVTYEKVMKTFIPEYVELLYGWSVGGEFVGKIFDTKKDFQEQFKEFKSISANWNWSYLNKLDDWKQYFKPSTKEAYDAQFVVKESEFVFPEKWIIEINDLNREFFQKERGGSLDYGFISSEHYPHGNHKWKGGIWLPINYNDKYTEITFEQFKKYVLKEEIKKLIPLQLAAIEHPNLVKSKSFEILQKQPITNEIISVANNEGNIFMIGDEIISTRSKNKNSNRISKIVKFRKNSVNDNILVIGDHYYKTGVSIDKIEHYIKPKKKINLNNSKFNSEAIIKAGIEIERKLIFGESNLEKAKRLYPIGTICKSLYHKTPFIINTSPKELNWTPNYIHVRNKQKQYRNIFDNFLIEKWAEIIGYEPQIGDKFNIRNRTYPFNEKGFQNTIYTIVKFSGSWNNPNSVITFRRDNWINDYTSTVLLKNIKIIK